MTLPLEIMIIQSKASYSKIRHFIRLKTVLEVIIFHRNHVRQTHSQDALYIYICKICLRNKIHACNSARDQEKEHLHLRRSETMPVPTAKYTNSSDT